MKRERLSLILILSILMLTAPTFASAGEAGKVEIIIGSAQELEKGALDWEKLRYADPVMAEAVVRTLKDSRLKIALIDGSFLHMTENSKAKIEKVSAKGKSFLRMFTGKVRAVVKKVTGAGDDFTIETPTAIVGVKGTDFVVLLRRDVTEVVTLGGSVSVRNVLDTVPGEVLLRADHMTRVTRNQPPTPPERLTPEQIERVRQQASVEETEEEEEKEEEEKGKEEEEKKVEEEEKRPADIEGTIEDNIETPPDVFDGLEEFGGVEEEVKDEIVTDPDIEDTEVIEIQDPPGPPPF